MPPALSDTPPAGPGNSPALAGKVPVQVAELVNGRILNHPLLDRQGRLLLAAGATISERFKEMLQARGIKEVMVHASDAGGPPEPAEAESENSARPAAPGPLNAELVAKLDEMVDSGRLFVAEAGPQFKEKLIAHGRTAYNSEQRDLLLKQHAATCSTLDGMIKQAMHGESFNGDDIAKIVGCYLVQFCFDADCVLEVASQARGFAALAEQSLHTSLLGMALAIEMGMAEGDIRTIGLCGLLHAWGLTRIPERIRNANRLLSQAEFMEIQKHPLYTLEMLQRISGMSPEVSLICYQVHEQPNGQGYPRGRRHEEIHPAARILHVADAYCALTSPRPHRLPLTPYAAVECLVRNAKEKSVDPEVVRSLLHVISLFPIGSYVVLSDTSVARVIRRNGNQFSCPFVQLVRHPDGSRIDPAHEKAIVDTGEAERKIVRAIASPGRQEIALRPEVQTLRRN